MPTRQRAFILAVTLLLGSFGVALPARGATSLQVDFGWDGLIRPGRWNPVFVTLVGCTCNRALAFAMGSDPVREKLSRVSSSGSSRKPMTFRSIVEACSSSIT